MTLAPDLVEAELAAGALCCPGCDGRLAPWGFAREREVRTLDGSRRVRPRRASCVSCAATHVILPASLVPRRRDDAEVIGHALLAKTQGQGHRAIAARLDRPPATVRGWLRAAALRAEALHACARRWTLAIDPTAAPLLQDASPLAGAIDALGAAARACGLQLGMCASAWELAVALTGGLLHGRPRDPPA
jgi:uncharacterized protein DUF6431